MGERIDFSSKRIMALVYLPIQNVHYVYINIELLMRRVVSSISNVQHAHTYRKRVYRRR